MIDEYDGLLHNDNDKMNDKDDKTDGSPLMMTTIANNENEQQQTGTISVVTTADTALPLLPLCQVDRYWLQKLVARRFKLTTRPDLYYDKNEDNNDWSRIKIYAAAPMVDQSDLPFRLQCRRYGTNVCFTPMIHARLFVTSRQYRQRFQTKNTPATDRPLIAQLCGGTDPETMLQCAMQLQDSCDGIDINCGCPQGIAKRGKYGAFLLEQEESLLTLIRYMAPRLKVPLSVKVRLLPNDDAEERVTASLQLYKQLVDAGIHLLTIHGRTRHQKGHMTGAADWSTISMAVNQLGTRIPVLANGSIASAEDVHQCLQVTKADGVMSSEAILEYPPLFQPLTRTTDNHCHNNEDMNDACFPQDRVSRLELALEYLELALQYPPDIGGQGTGLKCIRMHMHRFLHADLQEHICIRDALVRARTTNDLYDAVHALREIHEQTNHNPQEEQLSWYVRHRNTSSSSHRHSADDEMGGDDGKGTMQNPQEPTSNKSSRQEEEEQDGDEDCDCGDDGMFGGLF